MTTKEKATKESLTVDRLGKTEEVPTAGGTVTVRSVSHGCFIRAKAAREINDLNQFEVILLAGGITDPVMDEQEVQAWREHVKPGECDAVVSKILELSGLLETSPDPKASSTPSPETATSPSP